MAKSSPKNMTTELVDGRECEVLTLVNGEKVYFPVKFKGREYRALKPIAAKMVRATEDDKAEFDMSRLFESVFDMIPVLILQIKKSDGSIIPASIEWYDELEEQPDMDAVYKQLERMVLSEDNFFKKK